VSKKLSLYILAVETYSPLSIQQMYGQLLTCKLPEPNFRMNDSPYALFWWDMEITNFKLFLKKIREFQHANPFMSIFTIDHERHREYHKCK